MYEKALAQVNRHAWRYKKEEPGSSGGRSEVSKIRLPEIPLATFHGNPNEWVCYKKRFQALIAEHLDLSDPQKLTYLRNLLQGEAYRQQSPNGTYSSLWTALQGRYEMKRIIAEQHIGELLNLTQ
jgi:hypothetical protein